MKLLNKIMTFALLAASSASIFSMNFTKNNFINRSDELLHKWVNLSTTLTQALHDKDDAQIHAIMADLSIEDKNKLLNTALQTPTLDYSLIDLLLDHGAFLHMNHIPHFIQTDNVNFIQFLIARKMIVRGHWYNYSFASQEIGLVSILPIAIDHDAFKILNYLYDNNHITNITKREALDRTHKISPHMVEFLLAHGAQPSQYKIATLLNNDMLHEAELCLQHPTVTLNVKNNLLNNFLEVNCDKTILKLLIKNGAQISEEHLIAAIKAKNTDHVTLFLDLGTIKSTEQALKVATEQFECPQEILDTLLDYSQTIPIAVKRAVLHHSQSIHPKILSDIIADRNRIIDATDLNATQKEILLSAFKQLNLYAIFNCRNYDSIQKIPYLNISDALLIKYFPLGIWINTQHDKLNKCSTRYFAELDDEIAKKCMGFVKNFELKKDLTLTEQLFINLASNYSMVGENALFPGKDPKELIPYNKRQSHKTYYAAGFVGDLLKTNIMSLVTQTEQQFKSQDYQTFFHGRNWEWNFVNDMWNIVYELKTGEKNPEKISLRFRDQNIDIAKLQEYRIDLMQNGTGYIFGTGVNKTDKGSEVTCMNITPISNPGYYAECTGTYFLDNCSIARGDAGWKKIEEIFTKSNLESYFIEHKQELEALYNQHKQTNKFGELLCIAVHNNALDEMVYPAECGGIKVSGNATKNIKFCQESAATSKDFLDKNKTFYCLAVSDMPGEYGTKYQIKSLHLADPEKYEAYKEARDAFAAKMKADLQALKQE